MLISKKTPCISVIIPTYNCAEYIRRSIDSVLAQNLLDIEIIVVDDASSDETQDILNQYYNSDSRVVKFLHPENKGLGAARNTGIDASKGVYIFFLDADDWLEKGTLVHLISLARKKDLEITACGINKVWPGGRKEIYHSESFFCCGGQKALCHLVDNQIGSVVWNKLYLRRFIEENYLRFTPYYYHEDVMFTIKAVYLCQKYFSIHERYYNYFQRNGSIINSKSSRRHIESYSNLYSNIVDFIKDNRIDADEKGKLLSIALLKTQCQTDDKTTISDGLINIVRRYFSFVIYGRLRRPLRKIYYALKSGRLFS